MLADDGALDAPAVHAIRNTALAELRKRGISVAEDRRTDGVRPIDSALASVAYGVAHGCRIVRVHDVAGTVRVCRTIEAIQREQVVPNGAQARA